ncbi:tail fiber assembly protein, partial [Salmonella enterica]|nr:tail fiber assembly protein [Salmonella enterica]ECL9779800.1 tail fiber assembly protein [Salmonella enterica subsp. enterica serovar Rubislaw]ECS8465113.1 tail fiber assembly protein [Salmonella enterica subsp. enterica serovar Muenchen]EAM8634281.1 tail fiber assembly protein [Salmonella enterica]EAN4724307.1 tail fiber assembly protein [Salmonella enterica]
MVNRVDTSNLDWPDKPAINDWQD